MYNIENSLLYYQYVVRNWCRLLVLISNLWGDITIKGVAEKWGVTPRKVQRMCAEG